MRSVHRFKPSTDVKIDWIDSGIDPTEIETDLITDWINPMKPI
jgi:hypothetical protein